MKLVIKVYHETSYVIGRLECTIQPFQIFSHRILNSVIQNRKLAIIINIPPIITILYDFAFQRSIKFQIHRQKPIKKPFQLIRSIFGIVAYNDL